MAESKATKTRSNNPMGFWISAGIVFWAPAEPAYHYMTPPPYLGGVAKTAEAGAGKD
jgi:hypothetical protein